ncbi:MAG: HlyD family secretion protein, partial [Candidatus Accumulibacter sp.]|nr:HlyD family secretion protein [Accumulibacter sp.]
MDLRSILVAVTLACFASAALAHAGEDHGQDDKAARPAAASAGMRQPASPQRLPDGSLFVPKQLQRQIGLRTQPVRVGALAATVELNGQVVADPETGGRVQATFAGSVEPGPKGMPVPGREVARGEILAYLRPVSSAIERGNQKAQQAELAGQLAIADAR